MPVGGVRVEQQTSGGAARRGAAPQTQAASGEVRLGMRIGELRWLNHSGSLAAPRRAATIALSACVTHSQTGRERERKAKLCLLPHRAMPQRNLVSQWLDDDEIRLGQREPWGPPRIKIWGGTSDN